MISKDTYQLILGLFDSTVDQLKPTYLHLKHQLSLPLKQRVTPLTEDELETTIKHLATQLYQLEEAEKDYVQNVKYTPNGK